MAKGTKKQAPSLPRASDERWQVIRMGSDELEELLFDLRRMIRGSRGRPNKTWATNVSRAAVIKAVLQRREKIAPNPEPVASTAFDDLVVEPAAPEASGPPTLTKFPSFIDLCLLRLCRVGDVDVWVRAWKAGEPGVMAEEPLNFSLGLFADEMESWEAGTLSLDQVVAQRRKDAQARGVVLDSDQQGPPKGKMH